MEWIKIVTHTVKRVALFLSLMFWGIVLAACLYKYLGMDISTEVNKNFIEGFVVLTSIYCISLVITDRFLPDKPKGENNE